MVRALRVFVLLGVAVPLLALLVHGSFFDDDMDDATRNEAIESKTPLEEVPDDVASSNADDQQTERSVPLRAEDPEPDKPASPKAFWDELQRLRREDKSEALAYALRGNQWFPEEGKPKEARQAMVVDLLVDLGRMSEARKRAREFLHDHPHSSYLPLVQGVTGVHPRPGPPPGY